MEDKTIITYIKNGEEKVITFNKMELLNPNKKLTNIFKEQEKNKYMHYTISDDIELIYMKNYTFKNSFELKGGDSKKAVLILDNCTFCDFSSFVKLSNVEILLPKFKKYSKFSFNDIDDVNVVLDGDIKSLTIDALFVKNFTLESALCLDSLYLDFVQNAFLKEFSSSLKVMHNYHFGECKLVSNLTLENSSLNSIHKLKVDEKTKINLKLINSNLENKYVIFSPEGEKSNLISKIIKIELIDSNIFVGFLDFKMLEYLYLNNSYIKSYDKLLMNSIKKIIFDDNKDTILDTSSYLEVRKGICLQNLDLNGNFVVDKEFVDKSLILKRHHLINVLNNYKEKFLEENKIKLQNFILENREKEKTYKKILENKKIKELEEEL